MLVEGLVRLLKQAVCTYSKVCAVSTGFHKLHFARCIHRNLQTAPPVSKLSTRTPTPTHKRKRMYTPMLGIEDVQRVVLSVFSGEFFGGTRVSVGVCYFSRDDFGITCI